MIDTQVSQDWTTLVDDATLDKTVAALESRGFAVFVAENGAEAKAKVIELVPEGSEVFTAASATLASIGVADEINESGRYDSLRKKMAALNRVTQSLEMRQLGATPALSLGSAQAITEDGQLLFASFGGSQLTGYVAGATRVIWVVSTQKIVKDLDAGLRRIEEYALPLESERMQKLLGRPSQANKILILRGEVMPGRSTVILVKEQLGF